MNTLHLKHQLSNYLIISKLVSEYKCMQYAVTLYHIEYKLGFYPVLDKTCYSKKKAIK